MVLGITVGCGAFERDGKFLLQRRSFKAKTLPGRLEFPGGKQEADDPHIAACVCREWQEELGCTIYGGGLLAAAFNVRVPLGNSKVGSMDIFLLRVNATDTDPVIQEHQEELVWLTPDEILQREDLCPSNYTLAQRLKVATMEVVRHGER